MSEPTAVAKPASAGQELLVSLASAALLAGWIWWQMGWRASIAVVFGVAVHEVGHALVINGMGLGPARIQFVPFLGAVTKARLPAPTEFKGVLIALAGPLVGLLAAIPFLVAANMTGDRGWAVGAFFIAIINTINLAPAPPLDGSKAIGPALAAIHPMVEKIALLLVGGLAVFWALTTGRYIFGLFIGLSLLGSLRSQLRPAALKLTSEGLFWTLGLYVAVACLCYAALAYSSEAMGAGDDPTRAMQMFLG